MLNSIDTSSCAIFGSDAILFDRLYREISHVYLFVSKRLLLALTDTSLGLDVEELVLELFALVNEKNELFRRQAELMLLRRQQRLEEEHADIEYQVRCLITQPEATKTDFDKQREETLIQRLVEIVERRNEIVECLEMDRRREIEEDRSIHREMDLYAGKLKKSMYIYLAKLMAVRNRHRSNDELFRYYSQK